MDRWPKIELFRLLSKPRLILIIRDIWLREQAAIWKCGTADENGETIQRVSKYCSNKTFGYQILFGESS